MLLSFLTVTASATAIATVDKSSFEATINESQDQVLVAFTMPGCQQCEQFKPQFEEICQNRKCIQVDDINLGIKFQVEGFPTVGVFQNSYFKKFTPEKPAILDFLKELDAATSETITPSESWKKAKTAFAISATADATLAKEFRVARKFLARPGLVEYVETAEISDPFEISIFREGVVEVTMKWDAESAPMFRRILVGERVPLFGDVGRENFELYEYLSIDRSPDFPARGMVWVCFDAKALDEQRETNRVVIEKLARGLRRNFSFVWIDLKIFGEQTAVQIGCNMADATALPALVVHIPGEHPANLRRHQFNGAAGVFDEVTMAKFFENVQADKAEYFFRSKADGELIKDHAVPEISSKTLEATIIEGATTIVGVTVKNREICGEPCDKLISDLAVIRALVERNGITVRQIDGMENDPPRPFVFWENVPYLFIVKSGKQMRFEAQSGQFPLTAMLSWVKEQLQVEVAALPEGDEARRNFVQGISDSKLKAEVEKAFFGENEDDWDLDDEATDKPNNDEL